MIKYDELRERVEAAVVKSLGDLGPRVLEQSVHAVLQSRDLNKPQSVFYSILEEHLDPLVREAAADWVQQHAGAAIEAAVASHKGIDPKAVADRFNRAVIWEVERQSSNWVRKVVRAQVADVVSAMGPSRASIKRAVRAAVEKVLDGDF